MVDDKDKKDLDEDFSALSDALDNNDPAPSLEDLLKDHGIDLDSDTDVDAMHDFSLNDPVPDTVNKKGPKKSSEMSFDDFMQDDFTTPSDEDLFGEPPPLPPKKEKAATPAREPESFEDTTIFETSDFDDVHGEEFGDGSHEKLGDDALFDYDPDSHHETTFADVGGAQEGEVHAAEAPPLDKKARFKKIGSKVMTMVVLVSLIYGGLKIFMTPKAEKVAETKTQITPHPSISSAAKTPAPTPPVTPPVATTTTTTTVTPPTPAPTPEAPVTTTTATTTTAPVPAPTEATPTTPAIPATPPSTPETPTNMPAPGSVVASALPATTPVVTTPETTTPTPAPTAAPSSPATTTTTTTVSESTPSPEATIAAAPTLATAQAPVMNTPSPEQTTPAPASTPAVSSHLTMGNGDMSDKLDNLEQALQSIDQRLAAVSNNGMDEGRFERLERLVSDANGPEMQSALQQAVRKMKELDQKLERINDLQHQVRMLNSDIKTLKDDVETQTNIVGEQQRLYNDNVIVAQAQAPGPINMVVQAAIPGRAWLRSERGELLTVIPGDEVPGYGRVVSIDAASGTVVTSSRAVFREQ